MSVGVNTFVWLARSSEEAARLAEYGAMLGGAPHISPRRCQPIYRDKARRQFAFLAPARWVVTVRHLTEKDMATMEGEIIQGVTAVAASSGFRPAKKSFVKG